MGGFFGEAFDLLPGLGVQADFDGLAVVCAVAGKHGGCGSLQFLRLMQEVGAGTALMLGGVRGKLDAVDGEHFAADQPLPVAEVENAGKERGDLSGKAADECGECREVRNAVTGQRDKGDLLTTGAFDAARADDTEAVGVEDNLEEHGRRPRRGAAAVVAVPGIKLGEVEFVVDQAVEGVYEGAWDELPFEINGEKARTGIDRLVAGHGFPPPRL